LRRSSTMPTSPKFFLRWTVRGAIPAPAYGWAEVGDVNTTVFWRYYPDNFDVSTFLLGWACANVRGTYSPTRSAAGSFGAGGGVPRPYMYTGVIMGLRTLSRDVALPTIRSEVVFTVQQCRLHPLTEGLAAPLEERSEQYISIVQMEIAHNDAVDKAYAIV